MASSTTYPLPDPAKIAARLEAMGGPKIDPTKPLGSAKDCGVTLGWEITGGEITVTVLSKPFLIPYSTIWEHVDALFAA